MAACGSNDSGGSTTTKKPAAASTQTATPAAAPSTETTTAGAATPSQNAAVLAKCHATFDPILAKLDKAQSAVDGTLRYKPYAAEMSELIDDMAGFTSDRVPSTTCLKFVSAPTGGALLHNYSATSAWVACRKTDNCKTLMPAIQARWKLASGLEKTAGKGFSDVTAD